MKVEINGGIYDVPQDYVGKLTDDLWRILESFYEEQIPDEAKTALMIPIRAWLYKEEMHTRLTQGKEAARAMRPPPKTDVNMWLFRMFLPYLREQLNGSTITCETAGETVTAFNVSIPHTSQGGGQVGADRDQWVWQDHSTQVP